MVHIWWDWWGKKNRVSTTFQSKKKKTKHTDEISALLWLHQRSLYSKSEQPSLCKTSRTTTSCKATWDYHAPLMSTDKTISKIGLTRLTWPQENFSSSLSTRCRHWRQIVSHTTTYIQCLCSCDECLPARALMRDRSNSRAELFSLSQSSTSQRLLTSLYCCWISILS